MRGWDIPTGRENSFSPPGIGKLARNFLQGVLPAGYAGKPLTGDQLPVQLFFGRNLRSLVVYPARYAWQAHKIYR
jgi:hypothetical protein